MRTNEDGPKDGLSRGAGPNAMRTDQRTDFPGGCFPLFRNLLIRAEIGFGNILASFLMCSGMFFRPANIAQISGQLFEQKSSSEAFSLRGTQTPKGRRPNVSQLGFPNLGFPAWASQLGFPSLGFPMAEGRLRGVEGSL